MILQHFSDKPLSLDQMYNVDAKLQSVGPFKKPKGFWVSVKGEEDWLHWCNENDFDTNKLSICHNIEIDWEHILMIDTDKKFEDFSNEYHYILLTEHNIHWERVTQDYSGIIITPYFYQFHFQQWYYTWDCASGCIWNAKDVVNKITIE